MPAAFTATARARFAPVALLAALAASPSPGQVEIAPTERLEFDRPEAWGMKYSAAVLAFTPLSPPRRDRAGSFELALEVASVPALSREERRIGFAGTKVEDIDRAPAFGRLRASLGLPHGWRAELGLVPPVELDGIEPRLAALGLSRVLYERPGLRIGGRLQAQLGRIAGDITCSRADVAAGDDPVGNPFGCETPSRDELDLTLFGGDLLVTRPARRDGALEPYLALGAQRLDGEFQVDARYRGVHDRTRLTAAGWTWSATAGAGGTLRGRWGYGVEVGYSPLDIRRPGRGRENEPVLNLRLALVHRLR